MKRDKHLDYAAGVINLPFTFEEAPQWLKDMCGPPVKTTTFREFKPWVHIPKRRAFSTVDEYNRLAEKEK